MSDARPTDLTALLVRYVAARSEIQGITTLLRDARLARTDNLVGELGEYLALQVYGGVLAPTSARDIDLVSDDGRKIQVKTRALPAGHLRVYDFASLDFDLAVCVRFEIPSFTLEWVRQFGPEELAGLVTPRPAGVRLSGARARDNGLDVTDAFRNAWESIGLPAAAAGNRQRSAFN